MPEIRIILSLLPVLLLLFSCSTAAGQAAEILLVRSDRSPVSTSAEQAFLEHLAGQCEQTECPGTRSISVEETPPVIKEPAQLVVTFGLEASRKASRAARGIPQLHTLVSKSEHATHKLAAAKASAIYLEQPLRRQFEFIRFLMPKRRRIGVLLSLNTSALKDQLASLSKQFDMELLARHIDSTQPVGRQLHSLKGKVDVLLALPDPTIYNRNTLPTILLASYRDRIPVFGFSAGMVKAGAIAGIYSSPQSVGEEAAEMALRILRDRSTLDAYPSRYETRVNRRVAGALHIRLPTNAEIRQWQEGQ